MSLRQYLFVMIFATILCWISFGMVTANIDPFQGDAIGFGFFYTSLFFALLGTITVASFVGYRLFSRAGLPMFRYVKKSFRNGMFFSVIALATMYLQIHALLNLWNFTLFLLVVALIISFSVSTKQGGPGEGSLAE